VILIGTGSEVEIVLAAAGALAARGVSARVVALPSWELFEGQDPAYREAVLPRAITARVAVEAASTFGWERYVGNDGVIVGIDHFGASAPAGVLYREFGITPEHVVESALRLVGHGAPRQKGGSHGS
jgi:transketolase